mmetsp:Transcript_9185/g.17255  ORF Transcript_9185/g.17255 Transcript_9185/m.17255 type:complete len:201 (-) Transcript_9185:171-773(-)
MPTGDPFEDLKRVRDDDIRLELKQYQQHLHVQKVATSAFFPTIRIPRARSPPVGSNGSRTASRDGPLVPSRDGSTRGSQRDSNSREGGTERDNLGDKNIKNSSAMNDNSSNNKNSNNNNNNNKDHSLPLKAALKGPKTLRPNSVGSHSIGSLSDGEGEGGSGRGEKGGDNRKHLTFEFLAEKLNVKMPPIQRPTPPSTYP